MCLSLAPRLRAWLEDIAEFCAMVFSVLAEGPSWGPSRKSRYEESEVDRSMADEDACVWRPSSLRVPVAGGGGFGVL